MSAMRASTARAARSPLIRLCAFSSTMASAVAGGTSAFCRAALRSASLTKGMPADNSTCALDASSFGMAGLEATDPRKVVVSTAMRMAPESAVPMEAPRFVTVFCTPPTSPLCESGTAETVTAPSCEARVPIPSPARSSGPVTMSAPAPVERRKSATMPRNSRPKPTCTIRRGERAGRASARRRH